ncbi:Hypothetical predicted protein, partial [Marmota monax]
ETVPNESVRVEARRPQSPWTPEVPTRPPTEEYPDTCEDTIGRVLQIGSEGPTTTRVGRRHTCRGRPRVRHTGSGGGDRTGEEESDTRSTGGKRQGTGTRRTGGVRSEVH